MQKITIQQFGPIPNCELNIEDFMIFIGEQATGKSTICKCIYFFKSVRDEIKAHLFDLLTSKKSSEKKFPSSLKAKLKSQFIDLFGMTRFQGDFFLRYDYDAKTYLEVTTTNDQYRYLDFNFSQELIYKIIQLEDQSKSYFNEFNSKSINLEKPFFDLELKRIYEYLEHEVDNLFKDDTEHHYIPAGRGLLTLLANQLLNIELKSLDYITRDFLKLIQKEKGLFELSILSLINRSELKDFYKKNAVEQKMAVILKGKYSLTAEREYIKPIKSNQRLPINYASSGQQEVLWIINLLFLWMEKGKKKFIVIEEPEAHLFPSAQKEVIDFISLFNNVSNSKIMITTHSPYILTCANNLLYAGRIGKQNKEGVDKIIGSDYWINPDSFNASMVGYSSDRYLKSIVDEELKEIAAEYIDNISNSIRTEYGDIYNLEVENEFAE